MSNRLSKLRAMTPGEVGHRLAYRAYTAFERAAHARGSLARQDRLRAALQQNLSADPDWQDRLIERQSADRLFAWEDDPNAVRAVFQERFPRQLSRAREIADDVMRHDVSFFGETFRLGSEIRWHADPVTRAEWPRRYHRDVPVHGGNVGFGDVKYVWELNRHQFFVDLAKVAFLDGSSRHATALHGMLRSWTAEVPYATGVPWACALEPAFRAYSWLWAYHLLRAARMLDRDAHLVWLTGLYDHGRFLNRHLENYSSPYNHLTGEAATLFALGLLLPEVREATAWVERGRSTLEAIVGSQFHADGGSVEQSTFYHHATLGFYLLSVIVGRRAGVQLSTRVLESVERALQFSIALMQPDGRLPRIGGADDGKPIRLEHLPFWDFRPYYAIGAVLFSRPDFKFAAGGFWEDALWILGVEGLREFEQLSAGEPPRAAALADSGYFVVRGDWSAAADYLCFDCGEQAAGLRRDAIPSAAHGHADCLSVVLCLDGQEVLVDPGFFCYNGDPPWEVHFRKTSAHNTLTVDSQDQARHVSKMAWTHTYTAMPEGWSDSAGLGWARGSHDGYARRADGVRVRRTVWLRDEGYAVICDELEGSVAHRVQATYQFAPGTLAHDGSAAVLFNGRFELAWAIDAGSAAASVVCGADGPGGGWIARSLGVREAAPKLVLDFESARGRTMLITVIADRQRGSRPGRRIEALTGVFGARVAVRDGEDWIVAGSGRADSTRIDTDAALAAIRSRAGAFTGSQRIGGSYLRVTNVDVSETHPQFA